MIKEFCIGQIFEYTYSVEVAEWCNANNCYIEEIEPIEGVRHFEVKEVQPYVETEEEKRTRINKLSMTRGDLFEALILAFGKDENDILQIVELMTNIDDITKKIYINRIKNALDFYRGYPAVDMIGQILGITPGQLDKFFETKDWNVLVATEEDI